MNSSTPTNGTWDFNHTISIPAKMFFTVAYFIIFVVAIVGNSFVIHVARKLLAAGRGPFSMMVINMAAYDIVCVVIIVLIRVKWVFEHDLWFQGGFGTFLCKFGDFAFTFAISSSILTLTAMTVDRYMAIVPSVKKPMTRKSVMKVIWGIALTSIACSWFPFFRLSTVSRNYQGKEFTFCTSIYLGVDKDVAEKLTKAEYITYFVLHYALPVVVMSFLYFRIVRFLWSRKIPGSRVDRNEIQRRKHTKKITCMLITMATTFAFTWFPAQVARFYRIINSIGIQSILRELILFWFPHTNCTTNPCFYFIFCKEYQDQVNRLLRRFIRRHVKTENRAENVIPLE